MIHNNQMKIRKHADIKLVITMALKKEMPKDWFLSHGVPVHTLYALKSGDLVQSSRPDVGILAVITGAGPDSSTEAACWIRDNLSPLFVFNIGTCGVSDKRHTLGDWFSPGYAVNEEGGMLELDARLPVPYPDNLIRVNSLLSVKETVKGNSPTQWRHHDIVDMECYSQASVFSKANIAFHCLKFGSDYSDSNTFRDFNRNLASFRAAVKKLFEFIERNGKHKNITAIVPVYNREYTIKRAVDSILSQSHVPDEIIVVDDCSTDRTRDILESYGNEIRGIYLSKNSGPSRARNEGIIHARTEWLAFLDSDDCWEKDKMKRQIEYLKQYPFYQILQSEEKWIRNDIRVNPHKHHEKPEGWIFEPSLERCLLSPSSVLARKSLLETFGCFEESLPVCEDYDLWLKISRHHPVGLDHASTVIKYGGHKDQLSRKYPAMDRFRVESLVRLLKQEPVPYFREKIVKVLKKKLTILLQGYEKRQKLQEAQKCKDMLESL